MAGRKTRDGHKLSDLIKLVKKIEGIEIKPGTRHAHLLSADGQRPCPLATSTDARKMLTPWLAQVTGYKSKDVYSAIQSGKWYV